MTDKHQHCQLCARPAVMRLAGRWPRCARHASARIARKHTHEKIKRRERPERGRKSPRVREYDDDYIGAGRAKIDQSGGALGRVRPGDAAVYVCERCVRAKKMTLAELRAHIKQAHK